MEQLFGDRATCRYIDCSDRKALAAYPQALDLVEDQGRLPLGLVEGDVIVAGIFSPTRLDYEIRRVLATRPRAVKGEGADRSG